MPLPLKVHSNEAVIIVKGLKIGYGDNVLMEKLDFEVRGGEVFIILGGSGCGKSSLLKNLIGLYHPMAGEIWFGPNNLVTTEGTTVLVKSHYEDDV